MKTKHQQQQLASSQSRPPEALTDVLIQLVHGRRQIFLKPDLMSSSKKSKVIFLSFEMKTGDRNRSLLLNQSCEVVGNHVC